MKITRIVRVAAYIAAAAVVTACSTVALTGRRQLMLVSDQEVLASSLTSYKEYMSSATPSTNKANTAMVQRVGKRLANAVETYLKENGRADQIQNFSWEFNLVKSDQVNAFCMPGGKIVVYEGILPYTKDEASLAIVLGHEIAHAVANHSAERMSQQLLANYGATALSIATAGASSITQEMSQAVYGLGANYGVMLPFSRKHESEADRMGLIFAAMAGYDPSVAVSFWQRMAAGTAQVPEFLSDHPSDARRVSDIQKELPEALKYYHPAKK